MRPASLRDPGTRADCRGPAWRCARQGRRSRPVGSGHRPGQRDRTPVDFGLSAHGNGRKAVLAQLERGLDLVVRPKKAANPAFHDLVASGETERTVTRGAPRDGTAPHGRSLRVRALSDICHGRRGIEETSRGGKAVIGSFHAKAGRGVRREPCAAFVPVALARRLSSRLRRRSQRRRRGRTACRPGTPSRGSWPGSRAASGASGPAAATKGGRSSQRASGCSAGQPPDTRVRPGEQAPGFRQAARSARVFLSDCHCSGSGDVKGRAASEPARAAECRPISHGPSRRGARTSAMAPSSRPAQGIRRQRCTDETRTGQRPAAARQGRRRGRGALTGAPSGVQ